LKPFLVTVCDPGGAQGVAIMLFRMLYQAFEIIMGCCEFSLGSLVFHHVVDFGKIFSLL